MTKIKVKSWCLVACLGCFGLIGYWLWSRTTNHQSSNPNKTSYSDTRFYNQDVFYTALEQLKLKKYPEVKIRGAVIPHHLVPAYMIAGLMSELAKDPPRHIILVGPNHYEVGGMMVTARSGWLTPFGSIDVDQDLVKELVDNKVVVDDMAIANDHSVSGLVPFIKYYLPKAQVTPIILSSRLSLEELDSLIKLLNNYKRDDTVIIASVDFSHYLTSQEAEKKDVETLKVVKEKKYSSLLAMDNDHLDSPKSLVLLMKLMDLDKTNQLTVMDHNNSGKILNKETSSVTSYFWLVFN